jgi:hypothetical protein
MYIFTYYIPKHLCINIRIYIHTQTQNVATESKVRINEETYSDPPEIETPEEFLHLHLEMHAHKSETPGITHTHLAYTYMYRYISCLSAVYEVIFFKK